ncbi:MAG TPA: acetyl-CoA decarbonylase/synthase complex subunit gamma [Clostridiales bacterium]|nr:acetyl-CoA decarbonylase/synthase complex subunit gamma [Clostridiales bacterium]
MALTGLDIFKLLPKTNCGECGVPTCLAFAMALAAGKTSLEACPHVSEEAKETLGAAAAPPIRLVTLGTEADDHRIEIGDEQVLFRHDKTFYHPCAIAVEVRDDLSDADLEARLDKINGLVFERVGLEYKIDLVAVTNASGDAARFAAAAKKVADSTKFALMLVSEDAGALREALEAVAARRPVLAWATEANHEEVVALAKQKGCPVVIKGDGLDKTAELADKVSKMDHKDLILDTGARETARVLADLVHMRRLAIKKRFRPLGYPTIAFTTEEDPQAEMMQAATYVAKYASMIVIRAVGRPEVLSLLTWRQNVYTDPQKPIQVQSKVYEVGEPGRDAPVYITTNFSLTYYTVEGEVAASKIPSYIIPVDTDGTSVLTAWAAGKFTGESIAETMKNLDIESKVDHREVVIPGFVAVLSGKLQEASGWKVLVGPREAAGIPAFAKEKFGK